VGVVVMPVCRVCKKRIDLTKKGVRAQKCRVCGKTVCPEHIDIARKTCNKCLNEKTK